MTLYFDDTNQEATVEACAPLPANTTQEDIAAAYISLCDLESPTFQHFLKFHRSRLGNWKSLVHLILHSLMQRHLLRYSRARNTNQSLLKYDQ
jgi:hypothetical protein